MSDPGISQHLHRALLCLGCSLEVDIIAVVLCEFNIDLSITEWNHVKNWLRANLIQLQVSASPPLATVSDASFFPEASPHQGSSQLRLRPLEGFFKA